MKIVWLRVVNYFINRYSVPCAYCTRPVWPWQEKYVDSIAVFTWHRRCMSQQPTFAYIGPAAKRVSQLSIAEETKLATQHRVRYKPVYGDAIIENESKDTIVLEGPLLKRLVLAPGARHRIGSPILAPLWDPTDKHWCLLENDAKDVLIDMIVEWERGIWASEKWNPVDERTAPWNVSAGMLLQNSQLKAFRARGLEAT